MSSNILVAYFSAHGGPTKSAAVKIAAALNADVYEIEPREHYSEADLDWHNSRSRSSVEMDDVKSRPALAKPVPDLAGYDALILGFPIWWGVAPRVVDTFLDGLDLSGRRVFVFATSGSSEIEEALVGLKRLHPQVAPVAGKLLNHADPAAWAKTLKL